MAQTKVWAVTLHNNRFAILANDNDNDNIDDNESITTKINIALPVLNQATGNAETWTATPTPKV